MTVCVCVCEWVTVRVCVCVCVFSQPLGEREQQPHGRLTGRQRDATSATGETSKYGGGGGRDVEATKRQPENERRRVRREEDLPTVRARPR